jgi:isoleucyl-tRNA synthetase
MYPFKEVEEEVLKFWKDKKIFEKLRKQNKGKKKWSFIDGPITANNSMGIHHAWGRTYKDLFQRFKAMQGHEMRYQNGFDCQGLWVEREEEKDLGLKDKKDIEKFGILRFVQACRKRVEKFSKIQSEQSIKLGYWMDWDNSYYTMSDNNILHNWHLLKAYFEKGWLYKGKDAVPWCPRCGTASSKHDIVTEGYKEVKHTALFMQFPVKGKSDEYFLIFTTTPWTVPANVAIAVNEKIIYTKIKQDGLKYWIAEKRLNEIKGEYKIIEKKSGKQLEGIEYSMPYSNLSMQKNSPHRVVLWDLASEEEGTGIVHIAPGCGTEDFDLGKKLKFPAISPLDEAGNYKEGYNEFSLKNYKEVNKLVIEDLEKRKFVYKTNSYKHRYPHCWRCGEELVFRLVNEWYIKSGEIRNKLISENKKINWYPEYGKVRQEDWFKNMGDWLISRKRYWGLPLPIWECECGEIVVIGSLEELKKKAVDKNKVDKLPEIHRPWIDEIKIKCSKCKKEVSRILDVGDAWLDAGIVPFSTLNYIKDKKYWKEWFPADLISENMPGQYRGWFNALFWASVALEGKAPFKAMFGYETLKDEKGEEMHKSKGNAIWFDDALAKIGADTMRLLYCLQDPSQELRFGFNAAKDPMNQINIFYNMSRLIENVNVKKISKIEDKWILSRLNSTIESVTNELEILHPHLATRALRDFWIYDFSRRYIQIIRDRISSEDKEALWVLKEVYTTLLKLCSVIMPFITEKAWQELKEKKIVNEESVHLSSWPKADKKRIDAKLETRFNLLLKVIEKGLALRDKAKIGLKWPLALVTLANLNLDKEFDEIIKSQLNVKQIKRIHQGKMPEALDEERKLTEEDLIDEVKLDTNLTPELEAEGYARELSRKIQAFRKELGLQKNQMVETSIIVDEKFKEIVDKHKSFIKERTNSKKLEVVTTTKERFKNKTSFEIKEKRGEIAIVV